MLILTRRNHESVVVGKPSDLDHLLKVTVLEIRGNSVKLGFETNDAIPVNRLEVWQRIYSEEAIAGDQAHAAPVAMH
jgi:carbon storage regulator CsrA